MWQASTYGVAPPSLRQELQGARGFSGGSLFLAILGSVVGAVLSGFLRTGPWGALLGAAVGPLVSTVFTTKLAGERGRVRIAAIVILSLTALLITWTGFSFSDVVAGKSVIPGAGDRSSSFPGPVKKDSTAGKGGDGPTPGVVAELEAVQCREAEVGSERSCPDTTITYHGADRLHVTEVEVTGKHSGDFTIGGECLDVWLDPGESCRMTVTFRPAADGHRKATLVVHQNLPAPDKGTRAKVTGIGIAEPTPGPTSEPTPEPCPDGLVWSEADQTCVTPEPTPAPSETD